MRCVFAPAHSPMGLAIGSAIGLAIGSAWDAQIRSRLAGPSSRDPMKYPGWPPARRAPASRPVVGAHRQPSPSRCRAQREASSSPSHTQRRASSSRARAQRRASSSRARAQCRALSSRARAQRGRGISADRCAGDSSPSARNDRVGARNDRVGARKNRVRARNDRVSARNDRVEGSEGHRRGRERRDECFAVTSGMIVLGMTSGDRLGTPWEHGRLGADPDWLVASAVGESNRNDRRCFAGGKGARASRFGAGGRPRGLP
jgi:hypothetical protein